MKVTPLSDIMGAEVTDIDLGKPLDEDTFRAFNQALLDYHVLAVRDQYLSPPEQSAFTERFGALEWTPGKFNHPDDEKVLILSNEILPDGSAVGVVDAGDFWHSDSSHHEVPVVVTILQAVSLPPKGGETDFCNMHMVYDALPDGLQRRIAGLHGVHHVSKARNPRTTISPTRPGAADYYEQQSKAKAEVIQPVVRTHDETGRQALYVSPRFTLRIEELDDAEGQPLLDELFAYITDRKRRFHYRHAWRPGDLVLWDNRSVCHKAVGGYGLPDIRCLHRTTAVGNKAFYRPDSRAA